MDDAGTLLLIPQSWPYPDASEDTFIAPELPHLLAEFRTVVVAPLQGSGRPAALPAGCRLETGLLGAQHGKPAPLAMLRHAFASASVDAGRGMRARLRRAARAAIAARIGARLAGIAPRIAPALIYTYWFHAATHAACDLGFRCATRAHGYDLYEERGPGGFQPWRRDLLSRVSLVATVSDHGRRHLLERHGGRGRIETHRLGVPCDGPPADWDRDRIALVSCSAAVGLKRLPRIRAIAAAVAARGRAVHWLHLGDGPELAVIRSAERVPHLACEAPGSVPPGEVRTLLRRHRPLLFVNQSATEGVPVGIMEALSCGIPVCAGRVGGIPEIVDDGCAILHGPDEAPEVVAARIVGLASDPQKRSSMGLAAAQAWRRHCDPDATHAGFARRIGDIARNAEPSVVSRHR